MHAQVNTGGTFAIRSSLSILVHCCQYWGAKRKMATCGLDPQIYTQLESNQAQYFVGCPVKSTGRGFQHLMV